MMSPRELCCRCSAAVEGDQSMEATAKVHTAVTKDYAGSWYDGISYPSEDS